MIMLYEAIRDNKDKKTVSRSAVNLNQIERYPAWVITAVTTTMHAVNVPCEKCPHYHICRSSRDVVRYIVVYYGIHAILTCILILPDLLIVCAGSCWQSLRTHKSINHMHALSLPWRLIRERVIPTKSVNASTDTIMNPLKK